MMGSTSLGPKKGKKGLKSSGFLHYCIKYSTTTTKYGSWMQIPHYNSKSYVSAAQTPTRGFLRVTASLLGGAARRAVCMKDSPNV